MFDEFVNESQQDFGDENISFYSNGRFIILKDDNYDS